MNTPADEKLIFIHKKVEFLIEQQKELRRDLFTVESKLFSNVQSLSTIISILGVSIIIALVVEIILLMK